MHSLPSMSLIALVALAACTEATAEQAPSPATTPRVKITRTVVQQAPTPDVLTLTGRLTADRRAAVTADTAGKVVDVLVQRGQRVRKGQPVVQLDVRAAAIQTREAHAHLASAHAEQLLAEQECERAAVLLAKGAITKSESDRTSTRCASAVQQVGAARARAQVLAKGVSDGIVRAPFDGVVAERSVTEGEWVSPGRALFTLVDADPLRLELSVPEAGVRAVRIGQPVALAVVSNPDATYTATVTRIGAEIGASRSLIVEATLAPSDQLVPGMFAEAQLVVGYTPRPVLPTSAAIKRGNDWHVFVVREHELEDRIVHLGPNPGPGRISITDNLATGDVVVLAADSKLTDGLAWAE